jgi:hypothetical protein
MQQAYQRTAHQAAHLGALDICESVRACPSAAPELAPRRWPRAELRFVVEPCAVGFGASAGSGAAAKRSPAASIARLTCMSTDAMAASFVAALIVPACMAQNMVQAPSIARPTCMRTEAIAASFATALIVPACTRHKLLQVVALHGDAYEQRGQSRRASRAP